MQTRAIVRTAFILVFTLLVMVVDGLDLIDPWHLYSTFGYSADNAGIITAVDAQAARAGLAVGQHIDFKPMTPAARIDVNALPIAGDGAQTTLWMTDGRAVSLTAHPYPRSTSDNVSDVIATVLLLAYFAFAAALVLLRPSPATWAFFVFSYGFGGAQIFA